MSDWETVYNPEFMMLGNTLWWKCPVCHRVKHATWDAGMSNPHTGYDFPCEQGCERRHCVVWPVGASKADEATIYSYHRLIADKSGLPLLARL